MAMFVPTVCLPAVFQVRKRKHTPVQAAPPDPDLFRSRDLQRVRAKRCPSQETFFNNQRIAEAAEDARMQSSLSNKRFRERRAMTC